MDTAFLQPAFEAAPVATVVLTTGKHDESGAKELQLRWRAASDDLTSAGADEATLRVLQEQVDGLIEGSSPEGLVLVAGKGDLRLRHELPDPPPRDAVAWGDLPRLAEVIRQGSRHVSHLVVTVDRLGGALRRYGPFSEEVASLGVTGGDWPLQKVHAGGWSSLRYDNAVENQWEANVSAVAEDVNRIVKASRPALIVVAGDVRARQLLREHLSEEAAELVHDVDHPGDVEPTEEVINEHVLEVAGRTTSDALEEARRAIGQGSDGAGGLDEVCRALQRSQVDTLIVGESLLDADLTLHIGQAPTEVSRNADQLAEGSSGTARAVDALLRAAVATGVRVLVAADDALPASDCVATLRYADAATH